MKIKDLDPDSSLLGVCFIYPGDNQAYYWISQWNKGVWAKKNMGEAQVYPLAVEDLTEVLDWEVVE